MRTKTEIEQKIKELRDQLEYTVEKDTGGLGPGLVISRIKSKIELLEWVLS